MSTAGEFDPLTTAAIAEFLLTRLGELPRQSVSPVGPTDERFAHQMQLEDGRDTPIEAATSSGISWHT